MANQNIEQIKNQNIEQIKNHLEFLGYTIKQLDDREPDDQTVFAEHPFKPNLLFRQYTGGLMTVYSFNTSQAAKDQRLEFLEFINSINAETTVARCYASKEGSFVFEAWYNGGLREKAVWPFYGLFRQGDGQMASERKRAQIFQLSVGGALQFPASHK